MSAESVEESEYDRLGIQPTPDERSRLAGAAPWEESTRPHRRPSSAEVTYSETGRQVGRHLVEIHDMLRRELGELREVLTRVEQGAISASDARSALNEMALRQNDWALGAFCSRYCGIVTAHHGLEDDSIFPYLLRRDPSLGVVVDRLIEEHLVIHDAVSALDRALVRHLDNPEDYTQIQAAIDLLTDSLLSHLSYEEFEIVEPLARYGFYPGQL